MNAGVSGFKNAIVTKGILLVCGALSLALAARGDSKLCTLSYQRVIQRLEIWRLLMAPMVFQSIPELIFGLYLLYFFRVFERQVGSSKYTFFVLFSTAITTFLELVFLFALRGMFLDGPSGHSSRFGDGLRVNGVSGVWRLYPAYLTCSFSGDLSSIASIRLGSGPIGLIFSSFVSFFFDIPVSTRFKLLGVEVSEKSFVYFVGFQLLLWSGRQSLIPGICGVIAGFIYRYDVASVQEVGFSPGAFGRFAWRIAPFFSGISPEMAYSLNPTRSSETESRNGDMREVNPQNHYTRPGWNAERRLCWCVDCTSHRRKNAQGSGSAALQPKDRSYGAYSTPA